MTKNCKTCAWYCHNDGKCYGGAYKMGWKEVGAILVRIPETGHCGDWAFDGLEEWEREETEALMTMEPA